MKYLYIYSYCLLAYNSAYSQVTIKRNFNLELAEKDSITSQKLEKSLNAFLTEAQNGEYSSEYSEEKHRKKYDFFFRKLSSIGKTNKNFHNPLVLKSYSVDNNRNYRITVGFSGNDNGNPFLFQVTELKAIPHKNQYKFYCTFEDNTTHFKTKKINSVTYHFSNELNLDKATEFVNFKDKLSTLTKTQSKPLDYYRFKDLDELLKSYGFLYSARQCNFLCYDLGFTDNEGKFYLTGTNNENYIFGYLGNFLHYNLPNEQDLYWPFVNGIASYYGGYALSYDDMDVLKQQFRNKLKENPDINFLEEFKKGRKSSVNRHFSYYVMSAFLFEKTLKERGFNEALKLAYSGRNGENFFNNLKETLNIDESNFHNIIIKLINNTN